MGNLSSYAYETSSNEGKSNVNAFDKSKQHYYMVPESPWDHLEISEKPPTLTPLKVSTSTLYKVVEQETCSEERTLLAKQILQAIKEQQFFVINLSETELRDEKEYFEDIKQFFSLTKEEKQKFRAEPQELKSGWTELLFDNRDNLRDPEIRDVFQVRLGEEGNIPWPSEEFKVKTYRHYERQWNISMAIIKIILGAIDIPYEDFRQLITGEKKFLSANFLNSVSVKDYHTSPETNLSMFRYTDTQNYKTVQKCMVHRDNGFITLLPKSTLAGIQVLEDNMWIPMEEFTNDGEMLVYFGVSAELFSESNILALRHRVVRKPGAVRYSLPFEVKANRDAVISNDITGLSLEKQAHWDRVQAAVSRSDSVLIAGS